MSRIFHTRIRNKTEWEKIRRQVIHRDNFRCQSCGRILAYYNFEIDHVKPLHLMTDKEDPYNKGIIYQSPKKGLTSIGTVVYNCLVTE